MTLRTRKPTGRPAWPLVLLEGAEKSGKSWLAAELARSRHIGRTVWIDLGEGSGDEYLDPDDPRNEIVLHNGTYAEIVDAITTAKTEAATALSAGQPPTLIVVDSQTLTWELLSTMVDLKARARLARKLKRDVDADETVNIGTDLWNEANTKHRRIMTMLMTWPGIAVITARGKETVAMGKDGKPIEGKRDYKVEGQRNLGFDASIWVRLARDEPPTIHAIRTKNEAFRIRPGVDRPRQVPDLSLEWLLFDKLGYSADMAQVRDLVQPQVTAADLAEESAPAVATEPAGGMPPASRIELARLLREADLNDRDGALAYINGIIEPAHIEATKDLTAEQGEAVLARLRAYIAQQTPPPPATAPMVTPEQHRTMHAIWNDLGYAGDDRRPDRLTVTGKILLREVTTSSDLTQADADRVIEALRAKQAELRTQAGQRAQDPAGLDERRHRRLGQLLRRAGYDNTDEALAYVAAAVGRDLVDTAGITTAECDALLPVLEAEAKEARVPA